MAEIFNLSREEQESLQEILKSEKLCYNDIGADGVILFGVKIKHVHVGYFGFEQFGDLALFRSMLVQPDARKRGYGTLIWNEAKAKLIDMGVKTVFLLTDTAADFFSKQKFEIVERSSGIFLADCG